MTVPKAKKATQQKERQQLIQDIKQQNPSITDKQLSRYNIDDLRKIKMATAPKAETEKLSQVEQFDRDVRTGKFSQQYDTFRQPRMQYGGMADMSAAPMIKQPQQKKRKASGFRTKYSKGGGVRASKYKL
tara:strand:+ start:72 stop:461 length:390 start_codon:yes stop_codon:yes gene_type:complete